MTIEEYWDGDNQYPKYFREAEKLKMEQLNREAWLQGMYVYDAMARLSPIFNPFAKKGTKAKPYPSDPYPLTDGEKHSQEQNREKVNSLKTMDYMKTFAKEFNKKFEKGSER